jgi:hypothetical protein
MTQVKLFISTVCVFLILATGVVFNACTKDPCKDISCKNNGVCRDGRCKCPSGFEGPFCQEKTYEKFIGTWQGTYRCNGEVPMDRTVIIAPGEKPNEISMYNVFTQNNSIIATLDGDKITIPEQTTGNVVYKGSGYVEGIYITVFVEEKNITAGEFNSCVLNATKFIQP